MCNKNLCETCEHRIPDKKGGLSTCIKDGAELYAPIYKCEYKKPPFTKEDHIKKHKELHENLDMLVCDWILETHGLPDQATMVDLMKWSYQQTLNPTDRMGNVEGE